ncbi:OprD family outer membrane porin [Sulfurospirillum arcachonense]|uniref:OprD family outer membrane porin n=1 Tax=Sulfurospirillum arcachonense TaxID=57666 RepID=UPI000467F0FB|nr:OprD family outer membrane porin [Sulfurospirillum arcachonense]
MKLLNLSLAAVMAMGTVAFGADNLADSFKNGKLKGDIRAYYWDREKGTGTVEGDILNFGVDLNYVTDSFYGFRTGFSFQSSNSPFVDEDGKDAFKTDMWGPGAVLSEAYLSYTINKTTLKVGRQFIKMPLLAGSGSRIIKQAFEGATLVSKAIPNTTLYAAYVTKFQNRVDGSGDIADFEDENGLKIDENSYVFGVKNSSLPNTTLTAAYGVVEDNFDIIYVDAKYARKINNFRFNAAVQYDDTNYDDSAKEDASFYGLKLGGGIGGFDTYAAYAEVEDGTARYSVAGHGTKPLIFTSPKMDAGEYNESEQYALGASYNFKEYGLKINARYVDVDYANDADEADWLSLFATYQFSGALKGLSTTVIYEDEDHDVDKNDNQELRINVIYKF